MTEPRQEFHHSLLMLMLTKTNPFEKFEFEKTLFVWVGIHSRPQPHALLLTAFLIPFNQSQLREHVGVHAQPSQMSPFTPHMHHITF